MVALGEKARDQYEFLINTLCELDLQEAENKSIEPSSHMKVLGVLFDAHDQTMSVTPQRLNEITLLMDEWLCKKSASKRDLQSLIGKFQFVSVLFAVGFSFPTCWQFYLNLTNNTAGSG